MRYLPSGFEIGIMLDVGVCDVGLKGGRYVFSDVEEFDKILEDAELFRRRNLTTWTIRCGCGVEVTVEGDSESSCGEEECEFHSSERMCWCNDDDIVRRKRKRKAIEIIDICRERPCI